MAARDRALNYVSFAGLLTVAAALRLWHLFDIPSPTDELLGVARGLSIARGEILPLTDYESYIGALWNYLLALPFRVIGPSEYVGRGLACLVGVLTVPAAYLLGREMAGRLAGWVAAVLLSTSSAHILASSHPAWSHALVPLFGTLGLWQLQRGLRRSDGRGLLGCGLWIGLALQAHLTVLALVPGTLAFFWLKGRRWLKTPWPYLAGALALLMITNIIVYNLQTGFDSVRRAEVVRSAYASAKGTGVDLYVGNLERLGLLCLRAIGGAIDIRYRPRDYVLDPLVVAPTLLALGGLGTLLLLGNPLPLLVMLSYAALMVLFNSKYEAVPNARFITPLAPLLFACIGALAAAVWKRRGNRRWVVGVGIGTAVISLVIISIVDLARRYEQSASSAQTTLNLSVAVNSVEAAREPDEAVMLDRNLDRLWLDGGGDLWIALSFEFSRRGVPLGDLPGRVSLPSGEPNPCVRQQLVAVRVDRSRETPGWLSGAISTNPTQVPIKFWTFRVVPREFPRAALAATEHIVFEYLPPISASARAVDRCWPGRLI